MREANIYSILFIVITTFLASAIIIPFIKSIALHIGAYDVPNERKVHIKSMPRLGGLAIFLSFLLGYMLFAEPTIQINSILIGSILIILTGVIDDIKPLRVRTKLFGQIIATLVLTCYGGILLNEIDAFGIYFNFGIFAYPITIFFVLAIINAINLIDGLDGLAGGISSIFFLTVGVIAIIMSNITGLDVILSFIMLGATLGFLYHNFYPAKIFLGDSGSMFLGFMIATISLLGFKNVTLTSFIIPLLILGVPILDTIFAMIRRKIKNQPISRPDKEHLHHQLLNLNFSHRGTVLVIYAINLLFAGASIIYVLKDPTLGKIIYCLLIIIVILIIYTTDIISEKNNIIRKIKKNLK